jgi:hypothetical protein
MNTFTHAKGFLDILAEKQMGIKNPENDEMSNVNNYKIISLIDKSDVLNSLKEQSPIINVVYINNLVKI